MRTVFVSFIALFFLAQSAAAATVTFAGTVSNSITSDFAEGEAITATFEVDTENPLVAFSLDDGSFSRFSILSTTITIGDSFSASATGTGTVDVNNWSWLDDLNFQITSAFNGPVIGKPLIPNFFQLRLYSENTETLDSADFPASIDLAGFSSTNWTLRFADNGGQVVGSMTRVLEDSDVSAVPLPAGLPLLAAGLFAFGLMRRRVAR